MTNRKSYLLIEDNDCHWYLIPKNREGDFWDYLDMIENYDYNSDDPYPQEPEWLKRVDGPQSITIHEYTENVS